MIAWLKGSIIKKEGNQIIIDIGNIGYEVNMGSNIQRKLEISLGEEAEIVVYTLVKEDEITLYGFDSFLSRKIFLLLLNVNGIGPKVSMKIINELEPDEIIFALKNGNFEPFLQISGIGKKTAQRIILDLQGRLTEFDFPETFNYSNPEKQGKNRLNEDESLFRDASSALCNLGFADKEVHRVVRLFFQSNMGLNELIKKCLTELNKLS